MIDLFHNRCENDSVKPQNLRLRGNDYSTVVSDYGQRVTAGSCAIDDDTDNILSRYNNASRVLANVLPVPGGP
ncbi:unnamed protein product [Pylaiella littoralis]